MKHLTLEQRYNIFAQLQTGKTYKEIAEIIGVHPSTIGRELRRNCHLTSTFYSPSEAQDKAQKRIRNKRKKRAFHSRDEDFDKQ